MVFHFEARCGRFGFFHTLVSKQLLDVGSNPTKMTKDNFTERKYYMFKKIIDFFKKLFGKEEVSVDEISYLGKLKIDLENQ